MPGFKLEQVDGEGEGEHIDLPDGDSVIGRGPFLHVSVYSSTITIYYYRGMKLMSHTIRL